MAVPTAVRTPSYVLPKSSLWKCELNIEKLELCNSLLEWENYYLSGKLLQHYNNNVVSLIQSRLK